MAAPLTIPTSIGQTVGAVQNIASTVTAAGINVNGIASMSQAATNLTAAGANLLKLNQQATSAIKGLLPNSTLTVDAALSKVKVGLENTFSAQGAAATATDFFKAAKETADKIASDVKAVAEKIASGVDPTSLAKSATGGLSSLTNVVGIGHFICVFSSFFRDFCCVQPGTISQQLHTRCWRSPGTDRFYQCHCFCGGDQHYKFSQASRCRRGSQHCTDRRS